MERKYGISTALSGKYCFTDRLEELKRDGIDYIELALENLPRSCIGNNTAEIKKIMQMLPDIRLCFDCNHFTAVKPNEHFLWLQHCYPALRKKLNPQKDTAELYVSEFSKKIVTVHISDYDGINERHWLPGQGIINFKHIAAELEKSNFNAPVIFEPDSVCCGVVTTGKELISRYEAAISS